MKKSDAVPTLARNILATMAGVFIFSLISSFAIAAPVDGAALYQQRCSMCHDRATERAPSREVISKLPAARVVEALTTGIMKPQASGLSTDEVQAIAAFLTAQRAGAAAETPIPSAPTRMCERAAGPIRIADEDWNGWGRDYENTRYQPNPGLKAEDVPRLKVKWAFAYAGAGVMQPTIVSGRVFVADGQGGVYALDAQTGCAYWKFDGEKPSRTAITIAPLPASSQARFAAYFGDRSSNVYALDAETGKLLWKTKVDPHPIATLTGAPVVYEDRLYVPVSSYEETVGRQSAYSCCTFRGNLVRLDRYTGKLVWKSYVTPQEPRPLRKNAAGVQMYGPAGGAIWSAPTLDLKRRLIYAGTGDSYVEAENSGTDAIIAFDMDTGAIKWVQQVTPDDNFLVGCTGPPDQRGVNCPETLGPDLDFGSSPILKRLPNGKQVLVAGQKSGMVYGLDPDQRGKIIWQIRLGTGSALGGVQWGPATDGANVYVAVSDVIAPPGWQQPGLTALRPVDGKRLWHKAPAPACSWQTQNCSAALSAAVTVIPGVVFSGSLDGHLRGFSTQDGSILWDFDTAKDPESTVNGAQALGGSINGAGPTVVNGMVYVNSGYHGAFGGRAGGNVVLLAFSVDGK